MVSILNSNSRLNLGYYSCIETMVSCLTNLENLHKKLQLWSSYISSSFHDLTDH